MREEKILELISSLLDGELSPSRSAFVIKKIETDSVWGEKYKELRGITSLLSDVSSASDGVELSSDFDLKLRARLSEESAKTSIFSSIVSFFERRAGQLTYALVGSSLLFLLYVGAELYLKFGSPSSSSSDTVSQSEALPSVSNDVFTTVIKSNGELFVNKDRSKVVIDIYSGELKSDLDKDSEVLLRSVISNIDVYRKIYKDHYKPSRDFKRVSVPIYEAGN